MIGMFVGDQNSVNVICGHAQALQPGFRLTQGKPAIHKNQGLAGMHQGAITATATAQGGEAH